MYSTMAEYSHDLSLFSRSTGYITCSHKLFSQPTNSRKLPYDRDDMCITATMNKLRHHVYKCNDVLFMFFYSD